MIRDSGLVKKIGSDLKRDMGACRKKNMLRVLKSLIKSGVDGKEMEESIKRVIEVEEEAEEKACSGSEEGEEEEWERVAEEANLVIRSWRKRQKEAVTYCGMKAEEEAKIEAKEKEMREEKEKAIEAKERELKLENEREKAEAVHAKEREKENAIEEMRREIENEKQNSSTEKQRLEAEIAKLKAELKEKEKPNDKIIRSLDSITLQHSHPEAIIREGNKLTRSSAPNTGSLCSTVIGPPLTNV